MLFTNSIEFKKKKLLIIIDLLMQEFHMCVDYLIVIKGFITLVLSINYDSTL